MPEETVLAACPADSGILPGLPEASAAHRAAAALSAVPPGAASAVLPAAEARREVPAHAEAVPAVFLADPCKEREFALSLLFYS